MADESFDIGQGEGVGFTSETNGISTGAGAGSTTDAVDIVLSIIRQVEVKDVRYIGHLYPGWPPTPSVS